MGYMSGRWSEELGKEKEGTEKKKRLAKMEEDT